MRSDDAPAGVVDEAVGEDVATNLFASALVKGLDVVEDLLEGTAVEEVF